MVATAAHFPTDAREATAFSRTPASYPHLETEIRSHIQGQLTLAIVTDLASFDALRDEWNFLASSNQIHQLAFQSHGWLRAWLQSYLIEDCNTIQPDGEHSTQAVIVTVRVGGKLSVICPFAMRRRFGMQHLTWLGEPASQYGDVVTDGTATNALIAAAMDFVVQELKPDYLRLRKVRDDAAILPWLKSKGALSTAADAAPYLDFRNAVSFDDYCVKYSAKSRKNRRRLRKRLIEHGDVTTSVLDGGDEAQTAIRTAIRYKRQWLIDRGQVSSALRDKAMVRFLSTITGQHDANARSFVSVMRCGATTVSIQFGLIVQNRLALHMIAYNPETEKSGAGVLHIEDTIKHCIEQGYSELDFLAPDAAYKRTWADAAIPVSDNIVALTLRGRMYSSGYLCRTRHLLKGSINTLPLRVRRKVAAQIAR